MSPNSECRLVLVIDDDDAVRDSLSFLLKSAGYSTLSFTSGNLFLSAPIPENASAILLDMRMPGLDGLAVLKELAANEQTPPVIVMTGHGDIGLAMQAMKLGASDFLQKPFEASLLLRSLHFILAD